jgi:signal transduction histidine kinase
VISLAGRPYARIQGLDPERIDWFVAACLLIASEASVWSEPGVRALVAVAVWWAVLCVGLAVRRRWLLQWLGVALMIFAGILVAYGPVVQHSTGTLVGVIGSLSALLVFYGGGAFLDARRSRLALVLGGALVALSAASAGSQVVANLVWDVAIIGGLPWFIGRMVRERAARGRAARRRAELLDAQREHHAQTAALAERARLAREIHDVIAHSVSVMVISTAGARTVMEREPERAHDALLSAERAGREALAEMRRLLGVLGDGRTLRQLAPQPGIEDLGELVSRTREAGLLASISVAGDPIAVPAGLSLCVYRVVQEALTNAIKHAGAGQAEVCVRWRRDALELEVVDDGRGIGETVAHGGGHGLVGMRERTALHGGRLEAGPGPAGGFVVRAHIPLPGGSVLA